MEDLYGIIHEHVDSEQSDTQVGRRRIGEAGLAVTNVDLQYTYVSFQSITLKRHSVFLNSPRELLWII